jgi:glutamine amidotransferase
VIALIDYGAGNLTSVKKALAAVGANVFVPALPEELELARGIIVPGVGHFGATRALLGICLGMQWLFEGSEEAPDLAGLGIFAGRCRRIRNHEPLKIPHVGWNEIDIMSEVPVVRGINSGAFVYFAHSYIAPIATEMIASTEYGERFASIVERENIAGVQFHPEKSGEVGLRVLRNFLELVS